MSGLRLKTSIGIDSWSAPFNGDSTSKTATARPDQVELPASCRKAFGTNAMPTWIKWLQALKCSNTSPLITIAGGEFIH